MHLFGLKDCMYDSLVLFQVTNLDRHFVDTAITLQIVCEAKLSFF